MLQQQEQLKALQGRQAALLALQHKAEQAIAVMDDSGMLKFYTFVQKLSSPPTIVDAKFGITVGEIQL